MGLFEFLAALANSSSKNNRKKKTNGKELSGALMITLWK